jgi:hypothetical protein
MNTVRIAFGRCLTLALGALVGLWTGGARCDLLEVKR